MREKILVSMHPEWDLEETLDTEQFILWLQRRDFHVVIVDSMIGQPDWAQQLFAEQWHLYTDVKEMLLDDMEETP